MAPASAALGTEATRTTKNPSSFISRRAPRPGPTPLRRGHEPREECIENVNLLTAHARASTADYSRRATVYTTTAITCDLAMRTGHDVTPPVTRSALYKSTRSARKRDAPLPLQPCSTPQPQSLSTELPFLFTRLQHHNPSRPRATATVAAAYEFLEKLILCAQRNRRGTAPTARLTCCAASPAIWTG